MNINDKYEILLNDSPIKVSNDLNLKIDSDVKADGMCLSRNLEGSITCEVKDDIIRKDFKHKMHEYQKKTGKPRMVCIPESYIWEE